MGPKSRRIKKLPISSFTPDTNVHSSAAQSLPSSDSKSISRHGRVRSANRPVVSRKITQSTITHFHTLLKKQSSLKQSLASTIENQRNDERVQAIQTELDSVEREMTALGGLNAYQIASTLGQSKERGGDSSKVLVRWLDELGIKQEMVAQSSKLRMLEIGALMPDNYASCSKWIDNHPIDLHSQHPDILEQDFLQRPLPAREQDAFDVVSCSLVLNFVSSPADRGKMLSLIHKQLKDLPNSFLFLVLPLPCLANSRYLSLSTFQDLMRIIGFTLEREQWKPGGKVGYWLWRKSAGELEGRDRWVRKTVVKDGPKMNNFAVVLP
ncbi:hypothetical protein I302_101010 [Kwoniella bestiolae CBS 10118]|uniref:25S rRNA adenine-N(1) methyltransferase n=1 Tax=Kwoniella bestiolae CBS 10118 TaxID=1296100 RepID=A0A1B9G6U2_9TREE|nr:hypothetical protein I302_04387 [Kwoniella bestiolae CBS 10118]OCF26700.1 hypothetical protein I302_04387 [Kwoniella bestiolae CBS 10118]